MIEQTQSESRLPQPKWIFGFVIVLMVSVGCLIVFDQYWSQHYPDRYPYPEWQAEQHFIEH